MKGGKETGLDNISVKFLKWGSEDLVKWIRRFFGKVHVSGKVPEGW